MAGRNAVLAVKAGAIDVVVAAMRAHVGNADVSKQGSQAIVIMCFNNGVVHNFALAC